MRSSIVILFFFFLVIMLGHCPWWVITVLFRMKFFYAWNPFCQNICKGATPCNKEVVLAGALTHTVGSNK